MNTLNPDATVASTLSLTLTDDQQRAIEYINNFLRHPYDPIMTIDGEAGTGKSTVMAVVKDRFEGAVICAPTNKAVDVLRQKGFINATTLDKVINKTFAHRTFRNMTPSERTLYETEGWGIPDPAVFEDVIYEKFEKEDRERFVVVDEGSMMNLEQVQQLKTVTNKIICLGDGFQLPPVEGTQWFQTLKHDVTMNQIVRTGADSEITRLAGMLRKRDTSWEKMVWQNEVRKTSMWHREQPFLNSDVCIAHRNDTCNMNNYDIREIKGLIKPPHDYRPVMGDKLMAWITLEHAGIIKGSTYTVALSIPCNGGFFVRFFETHDAMPITIQVSLANLKDQATKDKTKGCYPFSFAHCITAHKSQGSEWNNVVVHNDYGFKSKPEYFNWLYTACTRAKSSLTIIQ